MLLFNRTFSALFLFLTLTQCHIAPLYSTHKDKQSVAALSRIKISTIEGRMGQIMHNLLLKHLTPQGQPLKPLYTLDIDMTYVDRDLGVSKDATTTRSDVTLTAHYILRDFETGKVIFKGKEIESTDYNMLTDSYYSNIVSKKNAQAGVAEHVAKLIKLSLATFLSSQG